jgi:hypothetical protein
LRCSERARNCLMTRPPTRDTSVEYAGTCISIQFSAYLESDETSYLDG